MMTTTTTMTTTPPEATTTEGRGKKGKKADHERSTAGIPVIILFPEVPRSWRKTHLHRTVTGLGHHGVLPE